MNKALTMTIGCLLIAVGPLIVLTATVYTLMLPKIYEGKATVAVIFPPAQKEQYTEDALLALTRRKMVLLDSREFYRNVITRLDLVHKWAAPNRDLPPFVAEKILENSILFRTHPQAVGLLEIRALRDDPVEAADIANAYAKAVAEKHLDLELIQNASPNPRHVSPDLFMNTLLAVGLAGLTSVGGALMLITGARTKKSPPPIPVP